MLVRFNFFQAVDPYLLGTLEEIFIRFVLFFEKNIFD